MLNTASTACTVYAGNSKDPNRYQTFTAASRFKSSFQSKVFTFLKDQAGGLLSDNDMAIFPAFFASARADLNELIYEVYGDETTFKVSLYGDRKILEWGGFR